MPGGSLRIQGLTVEAIIGAIFATHGSSAAQRAFYLHVLPHISSQLRDPMLVERAQVAGDEVRKETGGGVLLP
jgi:dsRNA-specific ribonuclease